MLVYLKVETSSLDGKGFATGFASSTVSGTEKYITNEIQLWKLRSWNLVKFNCYTLRRSSTTQNLQEL